MAEENYFQKALSNFTFEVASAGAIRHLADHGYTVAQIMKKLDFPTPLERVQKTVWEHLLDRRVITLHEPGINIQHERATYVTDYDQYGRKSLRKVTPKREEKEQIHWKEQHFRRAKEGRLGAYLAEKCRKNGEATAYVSCDFGLRSKKDPDRYQKGLQVLEEDEREYLLGIPWEIQLVYHRLDLRMQKIVEKLYESGNYGMTCYFIELQEKVELETK